ncbi:UNVERIFIED_CONTAM: TetR family transcriptional regulator [Williamsia faeni]
MARPRLTTDTALLDAAAAVLAQTGSAGFTLELAGQQAGVSAATLVKRFGSKRGLLIASSQRWIDSIDPDPGSLPGETPLATLRRLSVRSYTDHSRPDDAANHVSSLAADLGDPELTRLLALGWHRKRSQLERLISRAIDAGELPNAPTPATAARTLFSLLEGSFLGWTVDPDGALLSILDTEFDNLIASWT